MLYPGVIGDALGAHLRSKPVRQEVKISMLCLAVRHPLILVPTFAAVSSQVCSVTPAPGVRSNCQAQLGSGRGK